MSATRVHGRLYWDQRALNGEIPGVLIIGDNVIPITGRMQRMHSGEHAGKRYFRFKEAAT